MIVTIIVVLFLLVFAYILFVKWYLSNHELNKLRRKYNAEDDKSRRPNVFKPGADRTVNSSKQISSRNDEHERRELLPNASDLGPEQYIGEPGENRESAPGNCESNSVTDSAIKRRFRRKKVNNESKESQPSNEQQTI